MNKLLLLTTVVLIGGCAPVIETEQWIKVKEPVKIVEPATTKIVISSRHFTTYAGLECVTISSRIDDRAGISCDWQTYNYKKNNSLL